MSYTMDPGAIDPNEEPIPLEGGGSDEQSEWDSDGPTLTFSDRRIIPQQRAVWLADFYFGYAYNVERYATHGNAVRVRYASPRSYTPTAFEISLHGSRPTADLKASFQEHVTRSIEDTDEPSAWKFSWKTDAVTITRINRV